MTEQQDSVREDVKLVGRASRVINVRFAYFLSFFSIIVFGFLLKYILSISKISTINSKQWKSMKNTHNDWYFLLLKMKFSLLLAVALNSYQALVVQEQFFQIFLRIKFLVQTFILKECDSFFTVVSLTDIPFSVTDALKNIMSFFLQFKKSWFIWYFFLPFYERVYNKFNITKVA